MAVCCKICGHELLPDEIAVYRKLVNRGATQFCCIDCLAAHFHCPRALIEQKIEEFRAMGCMLFAPLPPAQGGVGGK